jgi:hypothetical protein
MFPHNYPSAFPEFRLIYHPDCIHQNILAYRIVNEETLTFKKSISIYKNNSETIILLGFPSLRTMWVADKRHVCEQFK